MSVWLNFVGLPKTRWMYSSPKLILIRGLWITLHSTARKKDELGQDILQSITENRNDKLKFSFIITPQIYESIGPVMTTAGSFLLLSQVCTAIRFPKCTVKCRYGGLTFGLQIIRHKIVQNMFWVKWAFWYLCYSKISLKSVKHTIYAANGHKK